MTRMTRDPIYRGRKGKGHILAPHSLCVLHGRFCFQRTSAVSALDVLRRCALQIYILLTYLLYLLNDQWTISAESSGSLYMSPLAGGGGILWPPHYRSHNLFVTICVVEMAATTIVAGATPR